ncbi:MAG TPA: response regulator transcription factor [Polyangiaceae bacterium]|nr:response regulator transcription factor [Polyangiaceae bacterium]
MTPSGASSSRPIRVVLVDDHPLVREGVRAVLGTDPELEVVAEAGNATEALTLADSMRPDVMVVDVGMKEQNGIALTRELSLRFPEVRVLILSMYESVKYVLSATRAGAKGYVLKDAAPAALLAAVRAVAAGGTFYGAGLDPSRAESRAPELLTPKELEAARWLGRGLSNKEAASRMSVEVRTLEKHRERIYEKLGVHSAVEIAKYLSEWGLL